MKRGRRSGLSWMKSTCTSVRTFTAKDAKARKGTRVDVGPLRAFAALAVVLSVDLQLDVFSCAAASWLGEIAPMMTTTRLLPGERRCRDEDGCFTQVQFFGGARRQSVMNVGQCREALTKAAGRPVEPTLLPHHRADCIGCDLSRAAIRKWRNGPARGPSRNCRDGNLLEIARNTLGEDQAFQQRIRGQAVRSVHTGA